MHHHLALPFPPTGAECSEINALLLCTSRVLLRIYVCIYFKCPFKILNNVLCKDENRGMSFQKFAY